MQIKIRSYQTHLLECHPPHFQPGPLESSSHIADRHVWLYDTIFVCRHICSCLYKMYDQHTSLPIILEFKVKYTYKQNDTLFFGALFWVLTNIYSLYFQPTYIIMFGVSLCELLHIPLFFFLIWYSKLCSITISFLFGELPLAFL